MASLLRVAELNNSGATMLVAARDKDAFKTLQAALSIMEQEMLVAPDKSESESTASTRSSTTISDSHRSSASPAAASEGTSNTDDSSAARFYIDTKCSTEIPELKDDRYFIFNQALLVETRNRGATSSGPSTGNNASGALDNQDPPPPRSQSLVCFYTSVVIYNLALAYHKRGMAASRGSSLSSSSSVTDGSASRPSPAKDARMALSQSLRLYEHCLKIVRSIANYSEDCKMLLYAVSCNLAHLYCRKGDRTRAQELLDNLEDAKRLSFQNLI